IEIFREENVPLFTAINTGTQKYGQISGAMTVEVDGKELTLQQAGVLLMSTDRAVRESVFRKITSRRLVDKDVLDDSFTRLVELRHKVARNAGFPNFRDYMFKALGRFDYTVQDCFDFHKAIETETLPILDDFALARKKTLKVDQLRPWDKAVDPELRPPLKPFGSGDELTEKTIEVFRRLDPYLGDCLSIMRQMG